MKHVLLLRHSALALALAAACCGTVHAQSTDGSIVGQAPVAAGETVLIQGSNGVSREVAVDSRGRYSAAALPLATYTVTPAPGRQDARSPRTA